MDTKAGIGARTEQFETACSQLAGALERFAVLSRQIAADFRAAPGPVRRDVVRPLRNA